MSTPPNTRKYSVSRNFGVVDIDELILSFKKREFSFSLSQTKTIQDNFFVDIK